MSPKPLYKLYPNTGISLTPESITERPNVCAEIAKCISTWSWVDTQVGWLYATLHGSSIEHAARLWIEMDSDFAKNKAILGAGLQRLPDRVEYNLLPAVLQVVKDNKSTRDKLAHWYWGVASECDDGLILVNPKFIIPWRARSLSHMRSGRPTDVSNLRLPDDEVYLWRLKDLQRTSADFVELASLVNSLIAFCNCPDAQDRKQLYNTLAAKPKIQDALKRVT